MSFFAPLRPITIACLLSLSASASAHSLVEAIHQALIYHPQIQASQHQVTAQQANFLNSQSAFQPQIILNSEIGRSSLSTDSPFPESGSRWPNSVSLVLSKTLYSGGALESQTGIAKQQVAVSEAQLAQNKVTIAIQTIAAYANVIKQQQLLALYQQSLQTLQQAQKDTQKRFIAGEVTKTDIALAEARVAEASANVQQTLANLSYAQAHLQQMTGSKIDVQSHLPSLPMPKDLATALQQATKNPSIDAQQHLLKAQQQGINLANSEDKAHIVAEARLASQDNTEFGYDRLSTWGVFVKAQLPLYQGDRTKTKLQQAHANYEVAQQQLQQQKLLIDQGLTEAWYHWQAAQSRVPAYQAQVKAADSAVQSTRKELAVGTRTTLDLLNAERELLNAQVNLLLSKQDQQLAAYQVLAMIGDLSVLEQASD